ncbi:MAG TPA: hypothetical protein VHV55_19955 [Pirellulales bacterium]|jgi:hypothetical protein|nr:hypothetical protein [Pirellulales bacterium]
MEMQQRLEKLEKERWVYLGLGFLAVIAGLLGALLGSGLVGGGGGEEGEVLQAKSLVLRGSADAIVVHDANGKRRIAIGLKDGQPEIVLLNKEGKRTAEFNINEEDLPKLAFIDPLGTRRQRTGLVTGGEPTVEFFGLNNETQATLNGDALKFFDRAGRQTFIVPIPPGKPAAPAAKPATPPAAKK